MKKLILVLLICLMAFVCFAQEKNEIPIVLKLTDGELKAILHYNETIEGFVQQVIEDKARQYMKGLVKQYRKEDIENIIDILPIKPLKSHKWSGLGMGTFGAFASYTDMLLANGFTELRIDIPEYSRPELSKANLLPVLAKGAKVIWGVSSSSTKITAESWLAYRLSILDAAQWAQDNGVYEFQLGNEEELHNDDTTLTDIQLIANLKSVATEVKKIFTNGKISYSCAYMHISDWIKEGKGKIDILAANIYKRTIGDTKWQTEIDSLVNAFGVDGTYLTEFNLSADSIDVYSTDEAVQAAGVTEMIDYIKASGMTRAFYFMLKGDAFGALKDDGTYRLLWEKSLLNSD